MGVMEVVRSGHILIILMDILKSAGFTDGIDVGVRKKEELWMNFKYLSEW